VETSEALNIPSRRGCVSAPRTFFSTNEAIEMSSSSGHQEPHRGTLILVLGILALVTGLGIILGPIAWIMGNADMKKIRGGTMDPAGEQTTTIGRVLGMVATILGAIGCCLSIVWVIVVFGILAAAAPEMQREMQREIERQKGAQPNFENVKPFDGKNFEFK
jgi:hypothetical protein